MTTETKGKSRNKGLTTGIVLVILGVLWMLHKMDIGLPYWLFNWEMILIYIGLFIGFNKGFQETAAWVLIGIGLVFLIDDLNFIPYSVWEFIWPVTLIIIGLVVIFKRRNKTDDNEWQTTDDPDFSKTEYRTDSRKLDSVSIFNGAKRTVFTKDFKGGESVTVFGGTELNLLHADFENHIELEAVVIFGGLKLIVPRHWEIRHDVTSIFAGVADKRVTALEVINEDKVLHLTGVVIFGGIDIVSY